MDTNNMDTNNGSKVVEEYRSACNKFYNMKNEKISTEAQPSVNSLTEAVKRVNDTTGFNMKKNIILVIVGVALGLFVFRDAPISLFAGFFTGLVVGAIVSKENF